MAIKNATELPPKELDPLFADIFKTYVETKNVTVGELNQKVETYVDSRIEKYLKKHTKL